MIKEKSIVERAYRAKLSKNAERHIRKHYREFGFATPKVFSREHILTISEKIMKNAARLFFHPNPEGDAIIFLDERCIVIVDIQHQLIKTAFTLIEEDYINRKLELNIWIEINREGKIL